MLQETVASTTSTTFTIYPILALLAVYAAGWWVMKRNSLTWENGHMGPVWKKGQRDPDIEWIPGSFERFAGKWENIWLGSVIFGSIAAITGGILIPNPYIPYIFGVFGFVGAFTGWTDLWTRKAPLAMSHLGLYALFPVAVFGILDPTFVPTKLDLSFVTGGAVQNNLYQFLFFSAVVPGLLWLLSLTGGIGTADVRGMWMVSFAFSWWVGTESMLLLSGISLVVQILAGIPARIFKWGEVRKSPFTGKPARAIPWLPAIGVTFTYVTLLVLVLPPVLAV